MTEDREQKRVVVGTAPRLLVDGKPFALPSIEDMENAADQIRESLEKMRSLGLTFRISEVSFEKLAREMAERMHEIDNPPPEPGTPEHLHRNRPKQPNPRRYR